MTEPLAHSARGAVGPQAWRAHTNGVIVRAAISAGRLEAFAGPSAGVRAHVAAAARHHDLGKLGPENQHVLATSAVQPLAFDHVDAGVAHLLAEGHIQAAVLAWGHHRGLCSWPAESIRGGDAFRNPLVRAKTDRELPQYLTIAQGILGAQEEVNRPSTEWSGLTWRLALSCLVDADYTDTAAHYQGEPDAPPAARWPERLRALDSYVGALARGSDGAPRTPLREDIYRACRNAPLVQPLRACESPVGTGKTTAVMAYMLGVAAARGLRHVFVVLPFTNIITQAVRTYREALVLPGEDPEAVVAEHHHGVDLASRDLRALVALWRAPIIVTTAVQFFETVAGASTARLRKVHELPGSAVFVDEAHGAIPVPLWPQTWLWLRELAAGWGCHFVFGSGSLVRFWELREVTDAPTNLTDLIPEDLKARAVAGERQRLTYRARGNAVSRKELLEFVAEQPGPRLLVVNTVQTAGVVADELRAGGMEALHVSTALCPDDRKDVLDRVRSRLRDERASDWTLVATSCVEAGLDLSFRTALRESASVASLIQVGGRVNRQGQFDDGVVWDFRLLSDGLVTGNPGLSTSREVLDALMREGLLNAGGPAAVATEALRREMRLDPLKEALLALERSRDFPELARRYRVITGDTRTVVIDRGLCRRIRDGERISPRVLLRRSVQLRFARVRYFGLLPLGRVSEGDEESALYEWPYGYDPSFLGIMQGALPIIRGEPEAYIL